MRAMAVMEMYTSDDLSGVSMVNTTMDLFKALADDGRRHYAQLIVPPRGGTYTWPDGFFSRPYCCAIEIGDEYPLNSDSPPISARLGKAINPGRGKILYDYVLNEKFFHTSTLSMSLYTAPSKWRQVFDVPVVNWLWESTLDDRLPLHATDGALSLLAAGTWVSDTFVMNDYDVDEFARQMRRFLPADRLETYLAEHTHVLRAGFDVESIVSRREEYDAARAARREDDPTLVLMHGGSFERKRRLPFGARATEKVREKEGRPVRMLLTTQHGPGGHGGAGILEERGAEVRCNVGRRQWLDWLGDGDLVYVGAEYEGTGLAYMEAILSGMLPVGFAETWISTRLPADYPLLVDTEREFEKALVRAVDEYDALKDEWHDRLVESLKPFDSIEVARGYDEVTRKLVDGVWEKNLHTARTTQPAYGILEKAVDAEGLTEIDDALQVYDLLTKHSDKGAEFHYVTPLALNWMLRALGFTDCADRPGLHLTRSEG